MNNMRKTYFIQIQNIIYELVKLILHYLILH